MSPFALRHNSVGNSVDAGWRARVTWQGRAWEGHQQPMLSVVSRCFPATSLDTHFYAFFLRVLLSTFFASSPKMLTLEERSIADLSRAAK